MDLHIIPQDVLVADVFLDVNVLIIGCLLWFVI